MTPKQMPDRIKRMRNELLAENPRAARGKTVVIVSLAIWLVSRLALQVVEIICAARKIIVLNPINIFTLIIMVGAVFFIIAGTRLFAALPIVGGVYMIFQAFQGHYFTIIGSAYYMPVARVYCAIFVISGVLQILVCAFVLIDRSATAYFAVCKKIADTVSSERRWL